MKRLLILLALLFPANSFAVPRDVCGDGYDQDSSGTAQACPAPDADADGYATDGTGPRAGIDCDDTDKNIFPGIVVDAGSGNVKTCETSGSYTTVALSAYSCKSGSGVDFWISPGGVTTASCGAYANPCQMGCFSNSGYSCYHAPAAGDCFIFTAGTYSNSYLDGGTTRMIAPGNRDGTSSDPIKIVSIPALSAKFEAVGTSTEIPVIHLNLSDYWKVIGFEIDGATGYSNSGIYLNAANNVEVFGNYVHDIRGNGSANNMGGIKFDQGADYIDIHNNEVTDIFDDRVICNASCGSPGTGSSPCNCNPNIAGVVGFDSAHFYIEDNVFHNTTPYGYAAKIKHGSASFDTGSPSRIKRNKISNYLYDCIAFGSAATQVENNDMDTCNTRNSGSAIMHTNLGGQSYFSGSTIKNNTITNTPFVEINPDSSYAAYGANILDISGNVVIDDRATSYPSDGTDGFIRIDNHGSDANFTSVITGGLIDFASNCFANSAAVALFESVYGNNSSTSLGTTYSTCAAILAGTPTHATSFCEDAALNSSGIATSTNCTGKGWETGYFSGTTTTTTTSTTTTTIAMNSTFNNAPQKNSLFRRFF